jgi:hypothetical protein
MSILSFIAAGLLLASSAMGQVGSTLPSTAFTRQLLTNSTAAGARTLLGLVTTNVSIGATNAITTNTPSGMTNVVRDLAGEVGLTNTAVVRGVRYTSITNAVSAAVAGDTVYVNPGTYTEHNLLKKGVNYHFYPGAKLLWLCSGATLGEGYGFFDDRATGATTNIITGAADCYYSAGTNYDENALPLATMGNSNVVGMILCVTNPATRIDLTLHDVGGDCFIAEDSVPIPGAAASPSWFYVGNAGRIKVKVNEFINSLFNWTSADGFTSTGTGVYWESGEMYFTAEHIGPWNDGGYAIWPNNTASDHHSDNLWVNGGLCEGYLYSSCASTNIRLWYNFQELRVTNSSLGAFVAIGGKSYLVADKISSTAGAVIALTPSATDGAEMWVTAQKITAPASGGWAICAGGNLWLSAQHYDAPSGTLTHGFNFIPGALTHITIEGGEAFCDGQGILWSPVGGYINTSTLTVKDFALDTSKANNAANTSISVGTNGVSVYGSRFKVPALATASITAAAAQTVGTYWSAANVTTNGNITFTPNAGWTVNAAVK